MIRRVVAAVAALSLLPFVLTVAGPARAQTQGSAGRVHAVCDPSARWHCRGELVLGGDHSAPGASLAGAGRVQAAYFRGYTAKQLQAMYGVSGNRLPGPTRTIAVVDAFGYPSAESDLAHYRAAMGLPACTTRNRCFRVLNQALARSPLPRTAPRSDDWTIESALDLDAASAICPRCHLVLVEANTDADSGLLIAARRASRIARYVSLSWGGHDDYKIPAGYLQIAGTLYTDSSGDSGHETYPDAPATLANVVSVGGVTRAPGQGTPTAWSGAGSSCSLRVPAPPLQAALVTGCGHKASSDVSALANPNTGLAVYDTANGNDGWNTVGGTSLAAPIVAGLYADAGNHSDPWTAYSQLATYPDLLRDITSGSNGGCEAPMCTAGAGWDGPTGLGVPLTPEAFALPLRHEHFAPPRLVVGRGVPLSTTITLPATVLDTAGTPQPLAVRSAQVTGLPDGLQASSGPGGVITLSGTPSTLTSGSAQLALTGRTHAGRTTSGTGSLAWVVTAPWLVATGKLAVAGTTRHGSTVRASLPPLRAGSSTGPLVNPTWRITWLLDGRAVHSGPTYVLPRTARGARLQVRARATVPGFPAKTVRSAVVRIR